MTKGVIVGCNQAQEWLLPWWWLHYAMHNNYPVTFFDFGDLSEKAIAWCQKRGTLKKLNISTDFIVQKENIDPTITAYWEEINPKVWQSRLEWFKKPFAFLESPYEETLWLDLDCQVRGNLEPIFSYAVTPPFFAISREVKFFQNLDEERSLKLKGEEVYNSAVVCFSKNNGIIKDWVQAVKSKNDILMGDQQVLARYLHENQLTPITLPESFNWRVDTGINLDALILHWLGRFHEKIKIDLIELEKKYYIKLDL